ncbi:hypothetical protein [Kutzneria chonburiensis]|uniref:Uncharacterized protein n=1 Tax=Kutzneria chonburiensis TaxID=1483604 RepID=A0ABV6MP80_9PSEU|nr:hypothetical protein [Kutzneria chonburiensis]
MSLLPAVVPLAAGKRSDLVPSRLAQNVAPLFGVPSPSSPFGAMTWVSEFDMITISEIARGAHSPGRSDDPPPAVPEGQDWVLHGRTVVAARGRTLPNEIINATTNRFGPNTKSAVLLTAANTLLGPVTNGMAEALPLLRDRDGGELPLNLGIAAWATAAIEAFRSQPALLIAAFQARTIQRTCLDGPAIPRAPRLRDRKQARNEIGGRPPAKRDPITHPRELHVLDRTVHLAGLPVHDSAGNDDDGFRSPPRGMADELVDHLVEQLLDASQPEGAGYVWISERAAQQEAMEAMLPSSGLVDNLLTYWFSVHSDLGAADDVTKVRLPSPEHVAGLSEPGRRVLVLAGVGLARVLRQQAGSPGLPVREYLGLLEDLGEVTAGCFEHAGPVAGMVRVRLAILRLAVLRHDRTNPIAAIVRDLIDDVDLCRALLTRGALDRGAVADLLSAACIELNAVRTTNAEDPRADLPAPSELDEVLRQWWWAYADALEIDLSGADQERNQDIGYHLHNYAAFLGSHNAQEDQREAVRFFRDFVIPSRQRRYRRLGDFAPLGRSCYIATASTSRLGEQARADDLPDEAARWAELGYRWIDPVLRNEDFARLLDRSDEQAGLFVLRAAPALLLALETGVRELDEAESDRLHRLLTAAERWLHSSSQGRAENYVRHNEVESIRKRVAELTGTG